MNLRIGLWGARADNCGLGTQTWEFFKHIQPAKTMVIDLGDPERKQYFDRYPGATIIKGVPDQMMIGEFLKDLDVVFTIEIPYNYEFFDFARGMGVKTVLQYNWEFLDYIKDTNLPVPDLFVAPSIWHYDDMPFSNKTYLPVPVNRDLLPYRRRTRVRTILHISGNTLYDDRNGTEIFLKSLPFLSENLKVIIYTQHKIKLPQQRVKCKIILRDKNVKNYWDIYRDGDLIVIPRKYGGLCLPLNEAMSTGMIPVMPDIAPQNYFLPALSLVRHTDVKILDGPHLRVRLASYSISPGELAEKINHLARMDEEIIGHLSIAANLYARGIDWVFLKPLYLKIMKALVEGK